MKLGAKHPLVVALNVGLTALLFLVFHRNFLHIAPPDFFAQFQLNGQARVLGPVYADRYGLDKQGAHLGKVYVPGPDGGTVPEQESVQQTQQLFAADAPPPAGVAFEPYKAQFGLQAVAYSALHRAFGWDLARLQLVPAFLFALACVVLFALYRRIYGRAFSALFLISLAASPWVIAMARNLYWNPFLWLLPAIAAAMLYLEARPRVRAFWYLAIFFSFLVKCVSNYEYITSVAMLACAVFLTAPYFRVDGAGRKPQFRTAAAVMATCVLAFAAAFLLHAHSRTGDLVTGVQEIYQHEVKRRTYGDPTKFSDETAQSLAASPAQVLKIYIFDWPEKRRMIIPGKLFLALLTLSVAGLALRLLLKDRDATRDLAVFVTFLSVPVSWFVLAKGHSFTQTHINFVLWYLGFIPALLFVSAATVRFLAALVLGRRTEPRLIP